LGSLLFAVGLTIVLQVTLDLTRHVAYGGAANLTFAAKASAVSVVLLFLAHYFLGGSSLPTRLIVYYIVALGGGGILLLPINHTGFWGWAAIDFVLFVVGCALFGGALLWANSYKSRQVA
jgi:hypothetical protein